MKECVKIISGNRIVIPEHFMNAYKLQEGDLVLIETSGLDIKLTPAKVVPREGKKR